MASAQSDKNCTICYEEREDLRMLPCWHVACISCILGMAQNGQGRALKCHTCREPLLFENIRSLPLPVRCAACQKLVNHPKKFSCCSAVYCTDCTENLPENEEGKILCPNLCQHDVLSPNELLQARICPLCFRMHSSAGLQCGHRVCLDCQQAQSAQQRNCSLCLAVNAPMPVPVNPALESYGDTGNAINNLPPLGNGQQISQMQLLSALQIVRAWQQRNPQAVQRPAQQPQQLRPSEQLSRWLFSQMKLYEKIFEKYMAVDLPKLVIATALFFIIAVIWGFNFWIWAVMTTAISILRPNRLYNEAFWLIFSLPAFMYAFWNHFFLSFVFLALNCGYNRSCVAVKRKFFSLQPFFHDIIELLFVAAKPILVYCLFPHIFIHIAVLDVGLSISHQFARPVTMD